MNIAAAAPESRTFNKGMLECDDIGVEACDEKTERRVGPLNRVHIFVLVKLLLAG